MRDLYSNLTASEQRAIRWGAAAMAAALWLATAWADPRILVAVPVVAGAYFVWVKRSRRREPRPEDPDWEF